MSSHATLLAIRILLYLERGPARCEIESHPGRGMLDMRRKSYLVGGTPAGYEKNKNHILRGPAG